MDCAQCGRPVHVTINPSRSPHSRKAQRGFHGRLKDHDLCRQCFRGLMEAEHARQLAARSVPSA